jgi:hypothetical protein
MAPEDSPFISDRSPTYRRAKEAWNDPDPAAGADGQTVGDFNRLIELERDMIAALLAVRNRLGETGGKKLLDELLADHADRLPILEQTVRDLGGAPPDPGDRPGDLPRDATDIASGGEREALRDLIADHEALHQAYRDALTYPHHNPEARHILEQHIAEMEQHAGRLASLPPV